MRLGEGEGNAAQRLSFICAKLQIVGEKRAVSKAINKGEEEGADTDTATGCRTVSSDRMAICPGFPQETLA